MEEFLIVLTNSLCYNMLVSVGMGYRSGDFYEKDNSSANFSDCGYVFYCILQSTTAKW